MKSVLETYIEKAQKDRQNLLSVRLLDVIETELINVRKSGNYLEIGETLLELSILVELKSELLLLLFSLSTFKRERKITEEEDVLEVFSIIKNSFKQEKSEVKRKYSEEEETAVPFSRLSRVIQEILEKEKYTDEKVVKKNDYSIKKAIAEIEVRLKEKTRIRFQDFFEEKHSRIEIVLMFLAILILAKNKQVFIRQADLFAPIFVELNEERRIPVSS
jgi:segregation and condensation protein A